MSYLHTKFHDNWISSFRGVAMIRFWDGRTDRRTDGQTDGVTALLDLLSPSATQVKSVYAKKSTCYSQGAISNGCNFEVKLNALMRVADSL